MSDRTERRPDKRWALCALLALSSVIFTTTAVAQSALDDFFKTGMAVHVETGRQTYVATLFSETTQNLDAQNFVAGNNWAMEYKILARRTSARRLLGGVLLQAQIANGGMEPDPLTIGLINDVIDSIDGSLFRGDELVIGVFDSTTRVTLNDTVLGEVESGTSGEYIVKSWIRRDGASPAFLEQLSSRTLDSDAAALHAGAALTFARIDEVKTWRASEGEAPNTVERREATVLAEPQVQAPTAVPEAPTTASIPEPIRAPDDPVLVAQDAVAPVREPVYSTDAVGDPTGSADTAAATSADDSEELAISAADYAREVAMFQSSLIAQVTREIKYPKRAIKRSFEGSILLEVVLSGDSQFIRASILESSKKKILDNEALRAAEDSLSTGIDLPAGPSPISEFQDESGNLSLTVPVIFRLF
ncbi:hypothetical protein A3709_20090 [Halioglobus sp. HI00S01]|uniref:TonB family protein n=1 Tax=Halioglobus sp. HI00S01 TaxID=1822214 RepID=UPI0007C2A5CB|nr:TonB family protein [Halioglobus sp. HI00S01]KZX57927.1 hypothetical protein A3709_20090 [Halioglobus sp. HI00S01]